MTEGTSRRAKRAQRKASGEEIDVRKPTEGGPPSEPASGGAAIEASEEESQSEIGTQRIKDRNLRLRAEAAARRKSKRASERTESRSAGLDAGEMVDDAFARSMHATTQWLRRNFNIVQWMVVVGVIGGLGWQVYSWRAKKSDAKVSDTLQAAIETSMGWVDQNPSEESAELFGSIRPTFPDDAARLKAATESYERVAATAPGSTASMLSKLGLAGILYEQGKFDKSLESYRALEGSKLAKSDSDVRGRVLEGIALSLEGKGDRAQALKAYRALENSDILGFEAAGLYHQARLLFADGKKEEASKALEAASKRLEKWTDAEQPAPYLQNSIRELKAAIDPSSAAMPQLLPSGAGAGGPAATDPEELKRMIQELMKQKGALKAPGSPSPAPDSQGEPAPEPEPEP